MSVWDPGQSCYNGLPYTRSNVWSDLRTFSGDLVWFVTETPTTNFQLNDFCVTLAEARIAPFQEIGSLKANHSTIAGPEAAELAIKAIQMTQPIQ